MDKELEKGRNEERNRRGEEEKWKVQEVWEESATAKMT